MKIEGKRILFIGAHPDDIELCAGGTISKLYHKNLIRAIVCASPPDSSRLTELFHAMKVMGLSDTYKCLNLTDTQLHLNLNAMIQGIELEVKTHGIDTVFTHYPHDTHQDHVAVTIAVMAACRKVKNIFFYQPTYPSGRPVVQFTPNLVIKLDKKDVDVKIRALAQHQTQVEKYGGIEWFEKIRMATQADAWTQGGFHGYCELFQISRIEL